MRLFTSISNVYIPPFVSPEMTRARSTHFIRFIPFFFIAFILIAFIFVQLDGAASSGRASQIAVAPRPSLSPTLLTCGNFVCSSTESVISCPLDCAGNPIITYTSGLGTGSTTGMFCRDSHCSQFPFYHDLSVSPSVSHTYLSRLPRDGKLFFGYIVGTPTLSGSVEAGKCNDVACTQITRTPIATGLFDLGGVVVPADDLPVLTYHDVSPAGAGRFYLVKCQTADCSVFNTVLLSNSVASLSSIQIGSNGNPVLAFTVTNNTTGQSSLTVLTCDSADCVQNHAVSIDTPNSTPFSHSFTPDIVVSSAGNPYVVFRYQNAAFLEIGLVRCATSDCSGTSNQVTTFSLSGPDTVWPAITLVNGDVPVIIAMSLPSLSGSPFYQLIKCADATCTQYAVTNLPHGVNTLFQFIPSITLGKNGTPNFVYNSSLGPLLGWCTTKACTSIGTKQLDGPSSIVRMKSIET